MSTSEYRSLNAESDLPISADELSALATQLFAAGIRPGPDTPPQTAPVAPRGNVPGTAHPVAPPTEFVAVRRPYGPCRRTLHRSRNLLHHRPIPWSRREWRI